ncbi:MAG TPA: sugar phosphate nucleotidyltransferase [Acidimicrobiales bacterium]|jgi:NDP-sugar pyrophosphorylase family protein
MEAIVMAGGLGTRLRPYTNVLPKPLLPVDGVPILEIILTQLRDQGFDKVTLALYYKAQSIQNHFGDGRWLGLDIQYSVADRLLGTAGPLGLIPQPEEPVLVCNADLLTNIDFADVMAFHRAQDVIATMVLCKLPIPIQFGVVQQSGGRIVRYDEKPTHEVLINAGIYAIDPSGWTRLTPGGYLDMSSLIERGMAKGYPIATYLHVGEWLDIGTVDQYHRAEQIFRENRSRYLRTPSDLQATHA